MDTRDHDSSRAPHAVCSEDEAPSKGGLAPAARFATAPPPPPAGSRSVAGGLAPAARFRDRSPAASGGLAPLASRSSAPLSSFGDGDCRRCGTTELRRGATFRKLRSIALALLAPLSLAACGQTDHTPFGVGISDAPPGGPAGSPCATPNDGCPCDAEGDTVPCGVTQQQTSDSVVCAEGTRTCTDGTWGACSTDHLSIKAVRAGATKASAGSGLHPLALAPSSSTCDEPCDPYCRNWDDTPDGLTLPDGLDASDSGVTLTQGTNGGNCSALTITPSSATITITSINSDGTITTTPSQSKTFTATCDATGAVVVPSWTLDDYDRAVVDANGKVTVVSGTAGPVTVTASNSQTSSTATLNVVVDMEDRGSSTSVATAFDGSGSSADAGGTLYPYRNTVFPLDLKSPLVQWQTGGKSASDVQVELRYPSGSSSPTFLYSKIYNNSEPKQGTLDTSVPAWRPPQEVWTAFGRTAAEGATAAARTGDIVVQRRYSSNVHTALTIPVTFATEPLRGTVYYTQYLRTLFTTLGTTLCGGLSNLNPATYTPGNICPVGNCTHPGTSGTSTIRSIDLSSPSAPNSDPFNGKSGCPVCHSVSADGSTFISGNQYWQTNGGGSTFGIDAIDSSGSGALFTGTNAAPDYQSSGNDFDANWPNEQSRGLSYSAITPDGAYALQGPSFWGNTANTPGSNNTKDATLKGVTGYAKPYFLVSTDNPGLGVQFATTAALPSNSRSNDDLNASSNGALTIDSVAMSYGYSVLVKDEGTKSKNGVYTVASAGSSFSKWKLSRRNDADDNGEIVTGMDVRVSDGNTNRGATFYVTTSGSININNTSISFASRSRPSFPSMMVPTFSPDGTKVAYVSADGDSISGYSDAGWRRGLSMFDFNESTLTISNKRRLLNHYSASTTGTPMKWPFFESDSRSLVYVETDPNEYCSSNSPGTGSASARACQEAAYGSMSPTTRGYWPGKVYSIDTANPSSTRVELTNLTDGQDSADAAKSYQPTILPFAVGGYRWAIFTSPRAYGNQFNARANAGTSTTGTATDFTCAASMLWVAAIDDTVADGTDRSHPAFFLPGQNVASITTLTHYINERGYLVKSPCKSTGDSCTSTSECCGGSDDPATAACRVGSGWKPTDGAPARTCQALSGTCSNAGESCDTTADCCGGAVCENFTCKVRTYDEASFTRDYQSDCGFGERPRWTFFRYHLATPDDSKIEFSVQTADTSSGLDSADFVSLGESDTTVEAPAAPESQDVQSALEGAKQSPNLDYLRVTITLVPSKDQLSTPTLEDWEMSYECEPAE